MTTTLILEHANEADVQQLLRLAQQLGVKATATPAVTTMSAEERRQRFLALAGSWQSDESGDEINQMLRDSRHFRDRDSEL
jgi:hypothetical protein